MDFQKTRYIKGTKQIELEVPVLKNDVVIRAEWNDTTPIHHHLRFAALQYFWRSKMKGGTSAKWTFGFQRQDGISCLSDTAHQ